MVGNTIYRSRRHSGEDAAWGTYILCWSAWLCFEAWLCLGFRPPAGKAHLGAVGDGSIAWVPATHMEDLVWVLGSWIQLGPAQAVAAQVESKPMYEKSLLLSFSPSVCLPFQ